MRSLLRDGLLALAVGAVLAVVGRPVLSVAAFVRPTTVAVGVGGAVAIEWLFLRFPERLLAAWERRGVAPTAALVVACLGVALTRVAPWVLAAVVWGLLTYLAIAGCVLAGLGNPVAWLVPVNDRE